MLMVGINEDLLTLMKVIISRPPCVEEVKYTIDMQGHLHLTVGNFIQWSFEVGSVQWIFVVEFTAAPFSRMMNGRSNLCSILGKYRALLNSSMYYS